MAEAEKKKSGVIVLGPGLIAGASDDDPSGIATYSQVGAQFGTALNWTLLFSFPFMCAIQMISANIGRVTGKGLAGYTTTVDGRHLAFAFYVNHVELKEPGEMSDSAMAGQALGELSAAMHLLPMGQ